MPSASSDIGRPASCLFSAESSVFIHQSAKICWKDRGARDEGGWMWDAEAQYMEDT